MSADKYVYCVVPTQMDWEDLIVFDNESDAIKCSVENPSIRVEIFVEIVGTKGYKPSYNYYKNGILYMS